MARQGTRLGVGALLLLGLVLALVTGELLLRVVRPAALSIVRYPCIYAPDPVLGFRYVPGATGRVAAHFEIDNRVAINRLGFYDAEPGPADAHPRVLALGDSFTAAMNVPLEAVWTSVLERALRQAGRARADVVNLGLDGTGTDVHLDVLERFAPQLPPDAVVLAFYANDPADVTHRRFQRSCHEGFVLSYQSQAQRDALRARLDAHLAHPWRIWLHEHLFWARLAGALGLPPHDPHRLRFLQPRLAELEPASRDARAGARRFRAAVRGLEAFAAGCDCRVWVAPVPPRADPAGSLEIWRRAAPESSLPVLDVGPAFARARAARGLDHADLYFVHDNHLNAVGNEIYGRAVAEAMLADLP